MGLIWAGPARFWLWIAIAATLSLRSATTVVSPSAALMDDARAGSECATAWMRWSVPAHGRVSVSGGDEPQSWSRAEHAEGP